MLLLHLGAFYLNANGQHSTFWHRLAPRTRILCVLLLLLAIVLTPNAHWWTWFVYAAGICLLIGVAQVPLLVLLQRLVMESAFVGVVLLGTLFRDGGEVIWQWGWLRITTTGLIVLGSVMTKAFLALLLLNVLTLSTSVPLLLNALVSLRTPPLLVAIMASMYRYIEVLINEFTSMRRAALSRNLMGNQRWQRLVVGNMIGSLFIRTYEQGERIHQAMLSRGYDGLPPVIEMPKVGWRDRLALTLTFSLAIAGQAIYFNFR